MIYTLSNGKEAAKPARRTRSKNMTSVVKPKQGRRPKPAGMKVSKQVHLVLWEKELDAFRAAAGVIPVSHWLRQAIKDVLEQKAQVDDPGLIPTGLGVSHPVLFTPDELLNIDKAVSDLDFPSRNALIRATGLWKLANS